MSKVSRLLRAASQLFRDHGSTPDSKKMAGLEYLLSQINSDDINFSENLISKRSPVTYMELYDDKTTFTASVFALREDQMLPLHDHPNMYGLIKCIHGTLQIDSYTPESESDDELLVSKCHSLVIDRYSKPVVLQPKTGNIHAISSVGGAAAFLDILAPPYGDSNKCHYYKIVASPSKETFYLRQMSAPSWYWCETALYTGPGVDHQTHKPACGQ